MKRKSFFFQGFPHLCPRKPKICAHIEITNSGGLENGMLPRQRHAGLLNSPKREGVAGDNIPCADPIRQSYYNIWRAIDIPGMYYYLFRVFSFVRYVLYV